MKADYHFLRLAAVGNLPGCSAGEAQAYRLAQCIVANVPGLDDAALDGLCNFVYAAQMCPGDARDLVQSWRRKQ